MPSGWYSKSAAKSVIVRGEVSVADVITTSSDEKFSEDVLEAELPVLVDFWADWCAPCKMLAPVINEIASENEDKLKVVKIDVDDNRDTASEYGVMSIPTLILFKDGEPVNRLVGFSSKDDLMEELQDYL